MHAALRGVEREGRVQRMGGGDQHRLDAPPADQGVGVGERPRPDDLAHRPGPRRVDICHSDDAHLFQRRHRACMGAPHLAHADHPELERLHADVSLTGWSPWGTSIIPNVSTKQASRAQTAIAAHGGPGPNGAVTCGRPDPRRRRAVRVSDPACRVKSFQGPVVGQFTVYIGKF